jgi:hypothetical protein
VSSGAERVWRDEQRARSSSCELQLPRCFGYQCEVLVRRRPDGRCGSGSFAAGRFSTHVRGTLALGDFFLRSTGRCPRARGTHWTTDCRRGYGPALAGPQRSRRN